MDLSKNDRLVVVPGVDVLAFNIPRFCWLEWQWKTRSFRVSVHEEWWPTLTARIGWIHRVRSFVDLPEYREPPERLSSKPTSFGFGGALRVEQSRLANRIHVTLPYRFGMGLADVRSLAEVFHAIAFATLPLGHGRMRGECGGVPLAQAQMIVIGALTIMPLRKHGGYGLDVRVSPAAREEFKTLYADRDVQSLQDTVKNAMRYATAQLTKKTFGSVAEKGNCVVQREKRQLLLARVPDVEFRSTELMFGEHFAGLRMAGGSEHTISGQLSVLAGFAALDHWLVQNAAIR